MKEITSGIYKSTKDDTIAVIFGDKIGLVSVANEECNNVTIGLYQLKNNYKTGGQIKEEINLNDAHIELTFNDIKSINIIRKALDDVEKKLISIKENIEQKVTDTLVEVLDCDKNDITTDTNLFDDLGADSLDATEIMMKLEKVFNIHIEDEEVLYKTEYEKVGNMCNYIREQLNKQL